jgi:hypothetical protein
MHLAVREFEELDRIADSVAPEPLDPQDRILERHRERRIVSVLCLALAAAAVLGVLDHRQAPVRLPFEQLSLALQALAAQHSPARVNVRTRAICSRS